MRISGRLSKVVVASSIILLGAWTNATFQRPIPVEVDNTDARSIAPSTVIDANGNALAIWSKIDANDAATTRFQASRYSAATRRWAAPVQIDTGNISSSAEISGFAGDPKGNAIALYGTLNVSLGDDRSLMVVRYVASANGGSWQQARRIDVPGVGFSLWERLAVDASGNAIVVWGRILQDGSFGRTSIFATRYTAATDSWSTPVDLSTPIDATGVNEVLDLDVAINARGTAYMVLALQRGDLLARRFNVATGRWEEAVSIPEATQRELRSGMVAAPSAVFPSIGVDARGNGIVAWAAFRDDSDLAAGSEIRSNRYDAATGRWTEAALIASEPAKQDVIANSPRIAVDAIGNAVLAWIGSSPLAPRDVIMASRLGALSSRWSRPASFADPSTNAPDSAELSRDPRIAVDAAGNAVLVWPQLLVNGESFRSNITASRYVAATRSWSEPFRLNDTSSRLDVDAPDLAMNGRGDAMVVWQQALNREGPLVTRIFSNPAIGR